MDLHLPTEMEAFVNGLVECGEFESQTEVILEALHLLKDQFHRAEERLLAMLDLAIEQPARGEVVDGEVVFSRVAVNIERDRLKELIKVGMEDIEAGRVAPLDVNTIIARVNARLASES